MMFAVDVPYQHTPSFLTWTSSPPSLPPGTTTVIEIDLSALQRNYLCLAHHIFPATPAAVLSANAYGLGAAAIAQTLEKVGCSHFFVAHLEEAKSLRESTNATIFCCSGVLPSTEDIYVAHSIVPILTSLTQIKRWALKGFHQKHPLTCGIAVDTGLGHHGLSPLEWTQFLQTRDLYLPHLDISCLYSTLSCSIQEKSPFNQHQLYRFQAVMKELNHSTFATLSDSHSLLTDPSYALSLGRFGLALYGLTSFEHWQTHLEPVLTWRALITQVTDYPAGTSLGIDRSFKTTHPSRIATVAAGYADGLPSFLGGQQHVRVNGYDAPIVGKLSMDSLSIDVTAIPLQESQEGNWVTLLDENMDIVTIATQGKMSLHEWLVRLGPRVVRLYKKDS